jgi:hypothetical protein
MRSLTARYPRLLAAFAVLGLLAACDKDKDVEPPAELVNFKESIKVQHQRPDRPSAACES